MTTKALSELTRGRNQSHSLVPCQLKDVGGGGQQRMRFAPRRRRPQAPIEPPGDRVPTRRMPRPVPGDQWAPAQPEPWGAPAYPPEPAQPERRPFLDRRRRQPRQQEVRPRRRRRLSLRIARVVVVAVLVQAL